MPTAEGRPTPEAPVRRTFGPVVLIGLGGSALATVGATKPWFEAEPVTDLPLGPALAGTGGQVPLAVSLGLVCLATWGALLVTRGRPRRALAALGVLAAAGLVGAWAWAWWSVPEALARDLAQLGATAVETTAGWWWWLSGLGALVALVAAAGAVRLVASWPEMGSRYDAPSGPPPAGDASAADSETSGRDLWRALDEGRDPTSPGE